MSLSSRMGSLTVQSLLEPIDATATVNATSGWVDVRGYEGEVAIVFHAGILDGGSVTWTAETADDGSATNSAAITFTEGALTQVTTSNDNPNIQIRTVPARALKGYVRTIGTIVTGGALVSTCLIGCKKYAA